MSAARPVQERIARASRGLLDAQSLGRRVIPNINVADDHREFESRRQRAAELLVAVRRRAQAVVEVRETGQAETTVSAPAHAG